MFEGIGWAATVVFASSYFCKQPVQLRLLQAFASLLWIAYGVILKAPPVIVANVVVGSLALWSAWQLTRVADAGPPAAAAAPQPRTS
jgi:hypothetical protein